MKIKQISTAKVIDLTDQQLMVECYRDLNNGPTATKTRISALQNKRTSYIPSTVRGGEGVIVTVIDSHFHPRTLWL
jgi:hypothetical protein